jgi:hypothetical protein
LKEAAIPRAKKMAVTEKDLSIPHALIAASVGRFFALDDCNHITLQIFVTTFVCGPRKPTAIIGGVAMAKRNVA